MTEEKTKTEKIEVVGEELLAKVKELVHEGNVRRISVVAEDGHRILEIPLTFGVVGALLVPSLVAVGAIAAIVTKCTIEIERIEEDPDAE